MFWETFIYKVPVEDGACVCTYPHRHTHKHSKSMMLYREKKRRTWPIPVPIPGKKIPPKVKNPFYIDEPYVSEL